MYDYLLDQAQAKRERVWAEIKQDRLISQAKKVTKKSIHLVSGKGVSKMKTKLLHISITWFLMATI